MAKFAEVSKGIRARKLATLPLPGAQVDPATGEWTGPTVKFDVRAVREDEHEEILAKALAFSRERGLTEPEDGDPIYERGKMLYTLLVSCLDRDSPEEKPEPFFESVKEIATSEIMTPEVVGYIALQQMQWQDEINPLHKTMTPIEFMAAAIAVAGGNMAFFVNMRPGMQWNFVRTLASQLLSSHAANLPSSTFSAPPDETKK